MENKDFVKPNARHLMDGFMFEKHCKKCGYKTLHAGRTMDTMKCVHHKYKSKDVKE